MTTPCCPIRLCRVRTAQLQGAVTDPCVHYRRALADGGVRRLRMHGLFRVCTASPGRLSSGCFPWSSWRHSEGYPWLWAPQWCSNSSLHSPLTPKEGIAWPQPCSPCSQLRLCLCIRQWSSPALLPHQMHVLPVPSITISLPAPCICPREMLMLPLQMACR